jgi:hypothetical protein
MLHMHMHMHMHMCMHMHMHSACCMYACACTCHISYVQHVHVHVHAHICHTRHISHHMSHSQSQHTPHHQLEKPPGSAGSSTCDLVPNRVFPPSGTLFSLFESLCLATSLTPPPPPTPAHRRSWAPRRSRAACRASWVRGRATRPRSRRPPWPLASCAGWASGAMWR